MRLRLLGTRIGVLGESLCRRAAPIVVSGRVHRHGGTTGDGDRGDRGVYLPASYASFAAERVGPHEMYSNLDEGLHLHISSAAWFYLRRFEQLLLAR
jgi:hypothetical protein